MMVDRARCLFLGIAVAFLVTSASGMSTAAGEGAAAAQQEPTLVFSPASGPCDGVVDMRGTGFEPPADPTESLVLYLVRPGTPDISMRTLGGGVTVLPDGTFAAEIGPGRPRCDAAALDSEAEQPDGHLVIAVTASREFVGEGQRIPGVIAVAHYAYTTTAPPSEPIMSLAPASGRCDAPTRVRGWGFGPPSAPFDGPELHLLQPGTADIGMVLLSGPPVDRDGAFSWWVGLREHGCEAAALDSRAEQPSGHLVIAATLSQTKVPPGERIPGIVATAEYVYTTAARHVPTEALTIVPTSGPCDGTVEVTGSGFEPGMEVLLELGRAASDASLGTLASPVADANGEFSVQFSLTELGCRAAELNAMYGDPTRPQLGIGAYAATRPTPVPPGIPPGLAGVAYTYTTSVPGAGPPAQTLPTTGSGPGASLGPPGWLVLIVPLAGLGLVLVVASLYLRRKRT